MHAQIEACLPQIEALCRRHYVRRLAVFGSALRDDFDPKRSDVDVLVDFDEVPSRLAFENYMDLIESLKTLFGRQVDLVSWSKIKNPYFRREIEACHHLIYAA